MYSKTMAILLNSIFGVCLIYTVTVLWFMLTSGFVTEGRFVITFSLYNCVWLALDIAYNKMRYGKEGGGLFFWLSMILPPILIMVILAGVILVFF